ncbi:MAG: CHAT domain-containing protein [Pirellulales bacterium]|nr:CHAT domain-containing protein [Pirellulales bacterium]
MNGVFPISKAWRSTARRGLLAAGAILALVASAARAPAQFDQQDVPTLRYRAAFGAYHDGEYRDALKIFQSEGRGAIKTAQARWIDSICYHAMCGECYYQMGQLPEAMEHYISAINLYIAYSDWIIRVKFQPLRPGSAPGVRDRPTWGRSQRQSVPGHFPDSMLISQGRLDANEAFRRGGVVQPPIMFGINVVEIVRCTALAIRRRNELLGPVSPHDPLSDRLLTALSQRPGLPNHWSECWIDLQLGLAQRAAGKDVQALATLQRAVTASGQFDHPMTCAALLELGKMALAQGDLGGAATSFLEATYSAAYFQDLGVLEEAFRLGAVVHLISNQKTVYPPLPEAIRWAGRNRYRQLQCSLLLSLAENHAALGHAKEAAAALEEAAGLMVRREMGAGRLGGRHAYLSALVRYQGGDLAGGDRSLATAMTFLRLSSHWLYQTRLADGLYTEGTITPRTAVDVFTEVLRDPRAADWSRDPAECLASLAVPHPAPLEHWFEAALDLGKMDAALEIGDRIRRHRFFSSLALGGRLESLRWLLEGPEELLDNEAKLHRRDLLVQLPDYAKLRQRAADVRAALARGPLVPPDAEGAAAQQKLLGELGLLAQRREVILREVALRRQPAAMVFPPLRGTEQIQKALPDGSAVLVFLATRTQLHAFLLNNKTYSHWRVIAAAPLGKAIAGMLHELGHHDGNRELPLKDLDDAAWPKAAEALLAMILQDSKADFATEFKQLIVVPDGMLWYVPFEMLQVSRNGKSESLISRLRIRYAPTVGLAVSDGRGRRQSARTGVVVGRLFPRDDPAVARAACDSLAVALPGTVALPDPLPAPSSLCRTLVDRLVVLDDLPATGASAYDWPPMGQRSAAGGTLADWMRLPWGGPETVVLPGYHTAAENGLKQTGSGEEMFLSLCGLMASGTRTVLMSRWRTGGQSSFQLVNEFAQELPHLSPAEAWQRAVLVVQESRVNLDAEPRIKRTPSDDPPKATHPFFWAGYLLVDSGDPLPKPNDLGPPVLKPPVPAVKEENEVAPEPDKGAAEEPKKEAELEPEK